ncbi:MAG: hypothetical protein IPJ77_21455 [Planctomycetes bacterium]|nr:hypothetical protein [Planctomycetota bacterium]
MLLRLTVLSAALLDVAACGRPAPVMARPTHDAALCKTPPTVPGFDFHHAKPTILPAHHIGLLTRFEGIVRSNCPDELQDEINTWEQRLTRDQRRDPGTYFANRFPKQWTPERTWYAGGIQGHVQLQYATIDETTFAIGAALRLDEPAIVPPPGGAVRQERSSLGWSSTAEPSLVTWIESDLLLPEFAHALDYGIGQHDRELVVVCAVPEGLREYAFEPAEGKLIERRRRNLGPPKAFAPLLVEDGADLLLFWSEYTVESSRPMHGGCALRVARLAAGTSAWSQPVTLTIDLSHGRAVSVARDQVTVAWSDDRFLDAGWAPRNGRKLCVSRSTDHGATWSAPMLLLDPEDNRAVVDGQVLVFDDGARILVLNSGGTPVETEAGTAADAFRLSRDLLRWAPEPNLRFEALLQLRREEIARWPR